MTGEAVQRAEQAVLQAALDRGYMKSAQVDQALAERRPGQGLLTILAARYLRPEQLDPLRVVYDSALQDSGQDATVLPGSPIARTPTRAAPTPPQPGSAVRLPPALPKPGERVGRCVIERELARGGMGAVYVAKDQVLEREVALKVMLRATTAESRTRFLREARAASAVSHPGLVTVHELGEDERGRLFIVMDLVQGRSLRDRIDHTGPLPQDEAAQLTADLARTLHCAHEAGVLHRDIKPANILLRGSGQAAITDFGVAKVMDENLSRTGQLLGTLAYMSPEQAAGDVRGTGPAADVYSLGATLYAMLTGEAPFTGAAPIIILASIAKMPPPRPSSLRTDLDPQLESVCLKCLAKDPADRYASAEDLAVDLEAYLAGEDVSAPERPRVGLKLAAGALVVLGVTAAVLGIPREQDPEPQTTPAADSEGTSQVQPPPKTPRGFQFDLAGRALLSEPTMEVHRAWLAHPHEEGVLMRACARYPTGPELRLPVRYDGRGPLTIRLGLVVEFLVGHSAVDLVLTSPSSRRTVGLRFRSPKPGTAITSHALSLVSEKTSTSTEPRLHPSGPIPLELVLSWEPDSGRLTGSCGLDQAQVLVKDPLPPGEWTIRAGLNLLEGSTKRFDFGSVRIQRLRVEAPQGDVQVVGAGVRPYTPHGRAGRLVCAGQWDEALQRLSSKKDRNSLFLRAMLEARSGGDAAAFTTLQRLKERVARSRDPQWIEVQWRYHLLAFKERERRVLVRVALSAIEKDHLADWGRSLVRAKDPKTGKDLRTSRKKWAEAYLAYIGSGAGPSFEMGRAALMSGEYADALRILLPMEKVKPGSTRGRAGYAAYLLRRYSLALDLWSKGRVPNVGAGKFYLGSCLPHARRQVELERE